MTENIFEEQTECPIVVICARCNTILGDTAIILSYKNQPMRNILPSVSKNVKVDNNLHVSEEGRDAGCSYHRLFCQCEAFVGKVYSTTKPEFEFLKDRFLFNQDAIKLYECQSQTIDRDPLAVESLNEDILKLKKFSLRLLKEIEMIKARMD